MITLQRLMMEITQKYIGVLDRDKVDKTEEYEVVYF